MAEYYPLLARAVAGMRNVPAEQRRAIYDRARQALLGQLRSMQPPVPEESINRESSALDEAIARVEADLVAQPGPDAVPPAAPSPSRPEAPPAPAASPAPASPPVPAPTVQPAPAASSSPLPAPVPVPPPPPPVIAMPPRTAPSRPGAEALSRIVAERGPAAPSIQPARPQEEAEVQRVVLPSAPRLEMPSFADAMAAAGGAADGSGANDHAAPEDADLAVPAREETLRPPAPRPASGERFNARALILAAVGIVVVAGIAYAAWRLRDRPEALARSQAAMLAAQQASQASAAKVSTRADGPSGAPAAQQPAPTAAVAVATPAPGTAAPTEPVSQQATAPANTDQTPTATPPTRSQDAAVSTAPAVTAPTTAAPTPAPTAPATGAPAIAVAQRAAFLVDAPEEPAKVKTYIGTVVWSTANASPAQDQPITRTVKADVEVPDAGLTLSMVFQKNAEPQFPASHTLELHFTLLPNNTLGPVKQINVPQMRKDESPVGDALTGLPVTITDNYFLIGLSRGDAVQRNLDLIKSRNWFDIPVLLASGKVAKITFEKGASGTQAIDDVLASWQ